MRSIRILSFGLMGLVMLLQGGWAIAAPPYRVLIVDGQNNHDWKATTPLLRRWLEEAKIFTVDVATTPPRDTTGFAPRFEDYEVVVSNYNGTDWPRETQLAFVEYMRNGGGLVIVHAANNAFGGWREYNEMIGIGGWGGRSEKSGPYVRYRDGRMVLDAAKGPSGSHGTQHDFQVIMRDQNHPITKGMPPVWTHARDELYDRLRGPGAHLQILATAYSDPKQHGSGEHEPMIFTVMFGKGRVFHTAMGHSPHAMQCVGFIVTYQRGTEWAATGEVSQTEIPPDFPTADTPSLRR